jgi:hypothetical protein
MAAIHATVPARSVVLSAKVIRANGTVENLGVIAHRHANPFIHLYRTVKYAVERKRRWLSALRRS